jgi:hypothetical protein
MQRLKTGTGFAGAKLSEILPCARLARFGQDDTGAYLPTMNAQLVVALPPRFSIANFFAPSTW